MRTRRTTLLSADRETQRAQQRTTQCCLPHQKRASMSRSTMWASASVPPDLACPELSFKNGALSWRDRQTAKFAARSSGPRKSASHSGPPPGWQWALPKQPQGWQHARERRHTPSWTLPPFLPPSLLVTLHPLELHHSVLLSRVTPKEATLGRVPGPRQGQVHCACTAAVACCAARLLLCCASPVACAASPPRNRKCQHTPSSLLPQAPVPPRQVHLQHNSW